MERLEKLEEIARFHFGSQQDVLRGLSRTTSTGERDVHGHPKTHEGYLAVAIHKAVQMLGTTTKEKGGEQDG